MIRVLAVMCLVTSAAQAQIAVTGPGGARELTPADLAALPQDEAVINAGRGPALHVTGPLLWTVLQAGGAIDPDFHHRVRQVLTVTGKDGYTAVLALGEIDPEFAGKPAIVALAGDDRAADLPRLVVPGDKRLGRSVRTVAALSVQ